MPKRDSLMRGTSAAAVLLLLCSIVAVGSRSLSAQAGAKPGYPLPRGLGSSPIAVPPDNPMTAGKIKLGEQLFFDKRLSRTKMMSCETCHVPEKGWTDGLVVSPRFDASMNTRHTPTLFGAAYYPDLYWDGRAKGLEPQILAAWRGQMGADPDAIAKEVDAIDGYKAAFAKELGGPATSARIVQALATFVRTIQAADTPWDRMKQDEASLPKSEIGRGFKVFADLAHCTNCHLPPLFSDTLFNNIGIGMDKEKPDNGRGQNLSDTATKAGQPVTEDMRKLLGAFKTPTLRGAMLHPPYFHDGRAATFEEAVDIALKGGIKNDRLDEKMQAWTVTPTQRKELLAFLRSLTPANKPYNRPKLP